MRLELLPLFCLSFLIVSPLSFVHSKRCKDLGKSLEEREEEANVVMTGTVRELFPHSDNPEMYMGEVEIKRVMKGQNMIKTFPAADRKHEMVMVDGIGDPDLCESMVHKYDTRIFLLSENGHGKLKLNSSVMRITLNNIDHADAVVKDMPFVPKPPPPQEPCEKLYCAFGAQCLVNATTNEPYCKCIEHCSSVHAPVCGSDGVTYSSECQMRRLSCVTQRRIVQKLRGACVNGIEDPCKNVTCPFKGVCVPAEGGMEYQCQCPSVCYSYGDSLQDREVCGSDGRDYKNECEMNAKACRNQSDLRVLYYGKCNPCKDHKCNATEMCQLDSNRKPVCKCGGLCSSDFAPVCGTDGKTYSNECFLKLEACKQKKEIHVFFQGKCDDSPQPHPCRNINCGPLKVCYIDRLQIARCTCGHCEPVGSPVCGTDGKTYSNWCELNRTACETNSGVTLKHERACGTGPMVTNPCESVTCKHGGVCTVQQGRGVCTCKTCPDDDKPVCGSNGITYPNLCKLEKENCELKRSVKVNKSHDGHCPGCGPNPECEFNSICVADSRGNAKCLCQEDCQQTTNKVCGTDGITYNNECELQLESCRKRTPIHVRRQGACGDCSNIRCLYNATCQNGRCICREDCPNHYDPVCGSDGETYDNECEMNREACITNTEISIDHQGVCDELSGSGSGETVCEETTCRFGGVCDFDAEGNGCVCKTDCPAIGSPVCGNDGKRYMSKCHLEVAMCKRQREIKEVPCPPSIACDGETPLVNPRTGKDYDCSIDSLDDPCPANSYCHKGPKFAKCCLEVTKPIPIPCAESKYGCCPDGKTSSPGPNGAGCPSSCECNPFGSFGKTCDPTSKQCSCKPGVSGLHCDRCEIGYWGFRKITTDGNSGCIPCNCNRYGTERDDCEQTKGRCLCKQIPGGVTGDKCDRCLSGKPPGPNGCDTPGPTSCESLSCNFSATCEVVDGQAECRCKMDCTGATPGKVCGSDGRQYPDECTLREFQCREQKEIRILKKGSCAGISPLESSTTGPPPNGSSRKTTRHLADSSPPEPTQKPPEEEEDQKFGGSLSDQPFYGRIGDVCQTDEECSVAHSHCERSFCVCDQDFVPSEFNSLCIANPSGISTPSFSGQSWLQFRMLTGVDKFNRIEITFKTHNKDGILLYNSQFVEGRGDFISLAIVNGYVEYRYDLGSGPALIRSTKPIQLNRQHHVMVNRSGSRGALQVDNGEEVLGSSQGNLRSLNLDQPLYVGGIPDMTNDMVTEIGTGHGLVGCVFALTVSKSDGNSIATRAYTLDLPQSGDIVSHHGIGECRDNPCRSLPCQNGGSCYFRDEENFLCVCRPGFKGPQCAEGRDPCSSNPCEGGSTCQVVSDNEVKCNCPSGRSGQYCENLLVSPTTLPLYTIPDFNGNSYIEREFNDNVLRAIAFEVWFLPTKGNGMILYCGQRANGKGDFISLNLKNGFLEFKFDLGGGPAYIKSPKRIALNVWHRVTVERRNRQGNMIINGTSVSQSGQSKGTLKDLNLGQPLYIGGFKDKSSINPDSGIKSGFHGAIQRLYINGRMYDNLLAGAVANEHMGIYQGPPCTSNPCQNGGYCKPKLAEYECKCRIGYAGEHCQRETDIDKNSPVHFDGSTFLQYDNQAVRNPLKNKTLDKTAIQRSQRQNRYLIRLRTTEKNGLVLIVHKSPTIRGDYLALAIVNGHVEFSYNLGKQSPTDIHKIRSAVRVDDGDWHTIIAERDKRKGVLTVDGNRPITKVSRQGATQLDTDGQLWIGGKRMPPDGLPRAYYKGFQGCIQYVTLDKEELHLVDHRKGRSSIKFCKT
ncbi:agrin-like isoform X3 [Lingula anatina]|uniref:Agrin-like isoform X3 n=1 Tax=Lingula anatina TaxID=7574 RepID=A0A2R2MPT7_LINAN|nr:agrin-like isoform X3 [Lingula anatina]|eukprot:XP_023932250.1 agrin-like isoform X3 [Lingula anatina]